MWHVGGKGGGHLCAGSPQMATNLPGFALLYFIVIRSHTTSSDGPKPASLSSSLTPAHLAFTCWSGALQGSEGLANKLNQLFELTQAWSTWPGVICGPGDFDTHAHIQKTYMTYHHIIQQSNALEHGR